MRSTDASFCPYSHTRVEERRGSESGSCRCPLSAIPVYPAGSSGISCHSGIPFYSRNDSRNEQEQLRKRGKEEEREVSNRLQERMKM
jgi:hypothetical protein